MNSLGLVLGMTFKLCTSAAKELKLKVRKFWGLIPAFEEVTGENWYGWTFYIPILNTVKATKVFQNEGLKPYLV